MKIARIMIFEKFNRRYINFSDANSDINNHVLYIIATNYSKYDESGLKNVAVVNRYVSVVKMFLQLLSVRKIVLYGLWHRES